MRRLVTSRFIWIYNVCIGICFGFQNKMVKKTKQKKKKQKQKQETQQQQQKTMLIYIINAQPTKRSLMLSACNTNPDQSVYPHSLIRVRLHA